ncbi:unknown [Prevotella sp. CAG:485]|nr:unknown [Prevotella sp. CAG:485]
MSEWLGKGLQNLLHQFESGWHLPKKIASDCVVNGAIFFFAHNFRRTIYGTEFWAQNFSRSVFHRSLFC